MKSLKKYMLPLVFGAFFLDIPQTLANSLDFNVHNRTGYTIMRLHVSDSRRDNWEEDVLDKDVLNSGQAATIRFSGSSNWCLYDLKAVFSDGDTAEEYEVNLCKVGNFYFNP